MLSCVHDGIGPLLMLGLWLLQLRPQQVVRVLTVEDKDLVM